MAKVYLSSTLLDLKPEREAVTRWLIAANHQPVHSYVADSESVHDSCLSDIDDCDLYVLLLGHRYGFVPEENNPEELAITQLEFRHAGQLGLPRIALLRTSVPDINLSDLLDPARNARLQAFRQEVCKALRPAEFKDEAGLIGALSAGVQRALAASPTAAGTPDAVPRDVRRASPPPAQVGSTSNPAPSWWATLPGVLTGAAALIAAIAGLIALFVPSPEPVLPAPKPATMVAPEAKPVTPVLPAAPATKPAEASESQGAQSVKTGDIGAGARVNIEQRR